MAGHAAWLGAFVAQGLDEYLRYLQTGQPMVEYGHEAVGTAVRISRKNSFDRLLFTIEVVPSSTGAYDY